MSSTIGEQLSSSQGLSGLQGFGGHHRPTQFPSQDDLSKALDQGIQDGNGNTINLTQDQKDKILSIFKNYEGQPVNRQTLESIHNDLKSAGLDAQSLGVAQPQKPPAQLSGFAKGNGVDLSSLFKAVEGDAQTQANDQQSKAIASLTDDQKATLKAIFDKHKDDALTPANLKSLEDDLHSAGVAPDQLFGQSGGPGGVGGGHHHHHGGGGGNDLLNLLTSVNSDTTSSTSASDSLAGAEVVEQA